jgi:hypothetical protein
VLSQFYTTGYKVLLAPTSRRSKLKLTDGYKLLFTSRKKQKRKRSSKSTERNPKRRVRYFAQGTPTLYTRDRGSLGALLRR